MTFSDSGAHVSLIMDSSIHTHLLAYWMRERNAFTLEEAVKMITLTPAMFWAWVAGLVELVGGAALLVGVLTRWTALILATDTIAALALYVAGAAVNLEVRLVALAALVSLALLGPQRFAADAALPRLRSWSGAATADATRKAA